MRQAIHKSVQTASPVQARVRKAEGFQGQAFRPALASHSLGQIVVDAPGKTSSPVQRGQNRTGLPDRIKQGVENLSGISLDDVRVHYNSARPAQLEALAFTQGTQIHVGPGQEQHLAHEAWHVTQQKQGRVQANVQAKGVGINDDAGLEKEADRMGRKAEGGGGTLGAIGVRGKALEQAPACKKSGKPA